MTRITRIALRAAVASIVAGPALAQSVASSIEAQPGQTYALYVCTPEGWAGGCYNDNSKSIPPAPAPAQER